MVDGCFGAGMWTTLCVVRRGEEEKEEKAPEEREAASFCSLRQSPGYS